MLRARAVRDSVGISGDVVEVGAPLNDGAGDEIGSTYVSRRDGGLWIQEPKFTTHSPPESEAGARERKVG